MWKRLLIVYKSNAHHCVVVCLFYVCFLQIIISRRKVNLNFECVSICYPPVFHEYAASSSSSISKMFLSHVSPFYMILLSSSSSMASFIYFCYQRERERENYYNLPFTNGARISFSCCVKERKINKMYYYLPIWTTCHFLSYFNWNAHTDGET